MLELIRRDALATAIPVLPIPERTDLRALPVGRLEDGGILTIRLHGTHLLIAGATGSGKNSYIWDLIRAMLPAIADGFARVHACDPKLMELAYGRHARKLVERSAIPYRKVGHLLRFPEAEIEEWSRPKSKHAARLTTRQRSSISAKPRASGRRILQKSLID